MLAHGGTLIRALMAYAPAAIQPMSAITYWLMFTLIARFSSSATLANSVLALAVTTPIFVFFNFQLRTLAISSAGRPTAQRIPLVQLRVVLSLVSFLLCTTIALLLASSAELLAIIIIFAALKAVDALAELVYGFDQLDSTHGHILVSGAAKWGALCILFPLVLVTTRHTVAALSTSFAGVLAIHFWLDVPRLRFKPHETTASHNWGTRWALKAGFMLSVAAIMVNAAVQVPKYGLAVYGTMESLAAFGVSSQFVTLGSAVADGFGPVVLLRIVQRNAGNALMALAAPVALTAAIGLVVYLAGPEIIGAIYGPRYRPPSDTRLLLATVSVAATAASFSRHFLGLVPSRRTLHAVTATLAVSAVASSLLMRQGTVDAALRILAWAYGAFTFFSGLIVVYEMPKEVA